MGYTGSGGPKALGVFNTTPSTASDLNQLLAIIAAVGNYRAPVTEAERDALTGDELYEGAMVFNTTAEALEIYDGAGWVTVWEGETASGSVVPTTAGVYSVSANELFTRNRRLIGSIDWSMSSGSLAHGGVICTLPVGARPPVELYCMSSGSPSPSQPFLMVITTAGEVTALSPPSGRTSGTLRIDMALA